VPVNLSIKNVPDELAEALRQRAAGHHRSLQGELIVILEEILGRKPSLTPLELLSKLREHGLNSPEESLRLVREDRREHSRR
jgi:antitoxin FitA